MAHTPEGPAHSESASVDVVRRKHRWHMSETAKSLWKWGIGGAVAGLGLLLATQFIVPVIPIAAATKAALASYGKGAAKWLLSMGGIFAGLGAGKTAIDAARA